MITGLFVYNQKGEVLISRLFREGVKRNVCEAFRIQVISKLSDIKSPVLTLGSTSFLHIRHGQLWIVAVTRSNVDASLVLEFLFKFVELLAKLILGNSNAKLTETDIKNNFPVIYEILDEVIEHGYVINMDLNSLQPYLTSPVTKLSLVSGSQDELENTKRVTSTASNFLARASTLRRKSAGKISPSTGSPLENSSTGTPWRSPGIKHKKNEVVVEVIEDVSLLMSSNGSIIRSFIEGTILMNAKLSGMPVCSFGLGHEESVDDDTDESLDSSFKSNNCHFHQCVSLKDFDEQNIIRFTPPEGEFKLMTYRANTSRLPFRVYITTDSVRSSKMRFHLELISDFPKNLSASNVSVKVPVPPGTINTKINADSGKAKFSSDENVLSWQIKKISGGSNFKLSASVETVAHEDHVATMINWSKSKPPVSLDFSLNSYSVSGNLVRFLNVRDPALNYSTVKSVKYVSRAKNYEIRI